MTERHAQSCIDPDLGWRIHEYELGTLDSETAGRFEEHVIRCDHCRHQMEVTMSAMTELATHRTEIRELLASGDRHPKSVERTAFAQIFRRAFQSVYVRFAVPGLAVAVVAAIFVLRNPAPPPQVVIDSSLMETPAKGERSTPPATDSATAGVATPEQVDDVAAADLKRSEREQMAPSKLDTRESQANVPPPPASMSEKISELQAESAMPQAERLEMESAPMAQAAAAPAGQMYRSMITREPLPWPLPASPNLPVATFMDHASTNQARSSEPSPADSTLLQLAAESYKGKTYGVAANYFEAALQLDSTNLEHKLMSGVSNYLSRQYWKAIHLLAYADSAASDARMKSRARWYLANTALALNDPVRADSLLESLTRSPSEYQDAAAKLLEAIRSYNSGPR